jgi:hypothetical protein
MIFAAQVTQVWTGSGLDRYKQLTQWNRIILRSQSANSLHFMELEIFITMLTSLPLVLVLGLSRPPIPLLEDPSYHHHHPLNTLTT